MSLINVLRSGNSGNSGMNAQSNRISSVAENIQNASTTGYKRTSTEFSSLLISSGDSGNYNSGAVETTIRRSVSEQGPTSYTTSKTDLAIQGNGFFMVQDGGGAQYLTRSGNFVYNESTGGLVNAGGFALLGYSLANGPASPALNSTDGMVPVNVASLGLKAVPSTVGNTAGNLDSNSATLTGALSTTNFTKKSSLLTYDNLGNKVVLDIYYGKTAANDWSAQINAPGGALLATIPLAFGADGKLTGAEATAAAATFAIPNGEPAFRLDMSGSTQLADETAPNGKANGQAPASVVGSEIDKNGTVFAIYDDASRIAAFQVALVDVPSPDNLDPRSGNVFSANLESGGLQVGFANQGGRGSIQAGALEQSNVDVGSELTSMIESQTVYTANSKVFMTGNELLETLMNLKR